MLLASRNLPYLAAGPAPALAFYLVFGAGMYSEFRTSRIQPVPEAQNLDAGSRRTFMAGLFLTYFFAFGLSFAVKATLIVEHRVPIFIAGLVTAAAGQAFRNWSVRRLGASFTYTVHAAADQAVIDTGPYKFIRHPGYAGEFLFVLGLTIALTNWLAPLMTVFTAVGIAVRIPVEERALGQTLGQPYRDYMRRTKRLIPFIL